MALDINALHANYQPMNFGSQVAPNPTPKKKGNLLTSLLPTIGGTAGGVGGGALGGALAGSAVLPGIGTVAGGLIGALAGGALGGGAGKVAENAIEHQNLTNGVAGEAALNGVLSAGPLRLLKGAGALGVDATTGLLSKALAKTGTTAAEDVAKTAATQPLKTSTAGKLESWGNNQLAKQWGTLDKPTIRATNPAKTVGQLADMGILKPQDAERVAAGMTGANGLVNQAVVKAVGNAAPVSTAGVKDALEQAIVNRNLSGLPQAKTVGAFVDGQLKKLGDNPTASDVFGTMKRLEKQAVDLEGKGGNYKMADPGRGDMADVYRDVRDHLQNALYKGAGANKNISNVLTPDLRNKLVSLHPDSPQWAKFVNDKVMNAKSIADLRSAQAPFVRAGKMIDNADSNSFSMGGKVGNYADNGVGIKGAIANAVAGAVKNPALRVSGQTARAIGSGTGTNLLSTVTAPTKKAIIRNDLLGALVGGQENTANNTSSMPASMPSTTDPTTMASTMSNTSSMLPDNQTQAQSSSPFAPANVENSVKQIIANGGSMDDVNSFLGVASTLAKLNPQQAASATPGYSKPSASQYSQAVTAEQSISQLGQMLQDNPGVIGRSAIPGQGIPGVGSVLSNALGTGQYRALSHNILNSIARINTGANMPAEEEQFYRQTYLPQPGDNPQTQATKIANLQAFFQPILGYQGGGGASDLLTALGGA